MSGIIWGSGDCNCKCVAEMESVQEGPRGCNGASAMEMGAGGRKQHLEMSTGESRAEEVVASATDPVGLLSL